MNQNGYLAIQEMETAIGTLTLSVYGSKLCRIDFGHFAEREHEVKRWAEKHGLPVIVNRDERQCAEAVRQLSEYFNGRRKTFTLPLLMKGTEFQRKVWKALTAVPFGETRSYKDIARAVNNPKGVRAIGMANNRNPIPIVVPCHRVIGANGSLVGYGGGLEVKQFLLTLEKPQAAIH
ncbi:methylated-DNA--[protein]-cysteine S-methyltransferase [Sporolactobacillus shoreicorticis]|uniref:Methylated-DNA--protein-cysteine methyltransferase n=1 Tax=Sporolactobacillus shoreicorticis TaxID=1923877 RepID=A0ABW5RYQ7_9BACL|nr:methylated-DNA--[protein]-cysteine S-methyltransferase [Sporolactobacillus shoreicorticis]MCO7127632.1 methylated-DNA--[protein]-cysteine S-methyltransferase [Sporolactobacillus shoreicorticis]